MRRFIILLLCCLLLTGVVYADNSAPNVQNVTTVYEDGSCYVMLTVNIRLDNAVQGLTFPLPAGAQDVTLNGTTVRTKSSADNPSVCLVDLSYLDGILGEQSLTFRYSLPSVVNYVENEEDEEGEGRLMLQVPLLSGFEYPVSSMSFSVTIPGSFAAEPYFYSGYFQQSIESSLTYDINGNVISGNVTAQMKDKETLTMSMEVSQEMFPEKTFVTEEVTVHLTVMAVCAGLTLLYWLLLMRSAPVYYQHRTTPIEGIHAGEIGSRLAMNGADLTMMVFNWAQLGYLRIQPDKRGRVWLTKRMEMGNERSAFEVRCFHQLFGKSASVDGTGSRYARLWLKVNQTVSGIKDRRNVRRVFRILACLTMCCAGVGFALHVTDAAALQVLLGIALAAAGYVLGWKIQSGVMKLYLRGNRELLASLLCAIAWIGLGIWGEQLLPAFLAVLMQVVAGFAAAYSGRRTQTGRLNACQLLGLRYYLRHVKSEELKVCMDQNPEYFFEMLPYAMAFGVEDAFARRFGRMIMPQCGYLDNTRISKRTAVEWSAILRRIADQLDEGHIRMSREKWLSTGPRR